MAMTKKTHAHRRQNELMTGEKTTRKIFVPNMTKTKLSNTEFPAWDIEKFDEE